MLRHGQLMHYSLDGLLVTSTSELVSVLVRTSAMIFASVFSSLAAGQLIYTVS
jgi:hypothetical protein